MVKFGPLVFYLFGPPVINLVLRFSIYSVLWIRSNVPVCKKTLRGLNFLDSYGLISWLKFLDIY